MIRIHECEPYFIQNIDKPKCANCKFYIPNKIECSKFGDVDIITGKYSYEPASSVRNDEDKCGEYAIFFKTNYFKFITIPYYFVLKNSGFFLIVAYAISPFIISNFLLYLITKDFFFYHNIFFLFFFLLIFLISFKKNFFLKFFPYFNIFYYDFYSIKKFYHLKKYLKITATVILIHFFSFTGFFLIIHYLNIKISAIHFFVLFFINYLSGLFQLFPSGMGIREFLFFTAASTMNLEVETMVHLSLVFTTFNISFSILILFLIKIFSHFKCI
jgi:hypothetical protein